MRIRRSSLTVALGALLALIAPTPHLHAQDGPGEEASSETLTVPFDPPIGEALAYTVTIDKMRPNGDSRMELEQELTFERLGDGYLLHLDMRAATIGGMRLDLTDEAVLQQMPAPVRPFVMSVAIELDAAGEPMRLRDWAKMRDMLQRLPELTAEGLEGDQRERAQEAARFVSDPVIALSAKDAPYAIVQGWPDVLGYGGLELEDGALYEMDSAMDAGLLPEPVPVFMEVSLSRTGNGDMRFRQAGQVDPEALREAVGTLRRDFLERDPARERGAQDDAEPNAADLDFTDSVEIVFASGTGIPTFARIERSISVGDDVQGNIVTITKQAE